MKGYEFIKLSDLLCILVACYLYWGFVAIIGHLTLRKRFGCINMETGTVSILQGKNNNK